MTTAITHNSAHNWLVAAGGCSGANHFRKTLGRSQSTASWGRDILIVSDEDPTLSRVHHGSCEVLIQEPAVSGMTEYLMTSSGSLGGSIT